MKWLEEHGNYTCRPYKISWCTRGYDAWCFDLQDCRRLGREIPTLAEAKSICEQHAQKVAA